MFFDLLSTVWGWINQLGNLSMPYGGITFGQLCGASLSVLVIFRVGRLFLSTGGDHN